MTSQTTLRAMLGGAVAGTISALAFTVMHSLMIITIWFMAVPMLVAGALCGMLLGWGYVLLEDNHTVLGWLRYNGQYLILIFLLGPISLLLFEPMITIPELLASPDGLPADLVREVVPLTAVYSVAMAGIITSLHSRSWSGFMVVLVATAALMFLLGLNIAPLGLVFLTDGWLPMLLELFALIITLNLVYALAFLALGRGWLWRFRSQIFST
jgi:hypothetical protein